MNVDNQQLFRELEPPRGGVERMRRKLAAAETGRARRPRLLAGGVLAAGAAAAVLAALVLVVRPWRADPPVEPTVQPTTAETDVLNAPELDRLLGREARPVELSVRIGDRPALAVELPSSDEKIRLYELN